MAKRVLVAVDGSAGSLAAVAWAQGLAARESGVGVTLLHVIETPRAYAASLIGDRRAVPAGAHPSTGAEQAPVFAAALAMLSKAGMSARTQVASGIPAEEIARAARAGGYDLIVVGRRGLNPDEQLLLGSVTERILHLAPCPVVVVREPGSDDDAAATRGTAATRSAARG